MPLPPLPPGMEFILWIIFIIIGALVIGILLKYAGVSFQQGSRDKESVPKMEQVMESLLEEIKLLRKEIRELREELKE